MWSLSGRYNVRQYASEILSFLNTEGRFLDAGYSLHLKREAWRAAGGIECDAETYMESDRVQAELDAILQKAPASSLDVERKHKQDKFSETTKVTGCARASRNSILRRYRARRRPALAVAKDARRKQKASATLNIKALAIERRPELLTRGRGQLRSEG